jgi:hypothetical protein
MVKRKRHGKRITGGHSTLIEGLDKFLRELEEWPEIRSVHPRHFTQSGRVGRSGGLVFRATRWETVGPIKIGIHCIARTGSCNQIVVLGSKDLGALRKRLQEEGLCDDSFVH